MINVAETSQQTTTSLPQYFTTSGKSLTISIGLESCAANRARLGSLHG